MVINMTDVEAYKIENQFPDIIIIDSKEKGVKYLFDGRKDRFAIAGKKGKVLLTVKQAEAIKNELEEILELRQEISERSDLYG
jgi:hypothetical protein